jgi:tight adherence protein B
VFTIGLRSRHFDPNALRKLAQSGSGEFAEATSVQDLLGIYDQLGTQLSHEYLLRYQSLAGLGANVKVRVKVAGEPEALTGGYEAPPLQKAPPPSAFHKGLSAGFWMSPFTMIVFSIFAIGLLSFCIFALLVPRQRSVQKRLAEFVSLEATESHAGHLVPAAMIESTESSLESSPRWQRFKEECEIGEIEMSPSHIAIWTLVGTIAFMWAVAVFFSFAAVLLGVFVPLAVWGYVHRKAERRRALFAEQLPDNLAVLASALRAGHSLVGALSVVVNDAADPAKSEFQRVVADEQLGRPLDEALESVVQRMQNKDLAQVALVAALQRETGGSTAEVLDRVVETVRDRQELRRLVKTLTAAGRMSRWVVSLLPVALILAISIMSPGYLKPLFAHTTGRVLFVFAALLVISGSLVIKRIVDIKV